ncbi:uncharacterized protein [Antedon mediterranea]|uniref:uncharacterized protein n=1 Tax=Antedon mediterranea TaxID=105859 RepID=UPI003AF85C98
MRIETMNKWIYTLQTKVGGPLIGKIDCHHTSQKGHIPDKMNRQTMKADKIDNALTITSSTRKERKLRRNMTEPTVLPSIHSSKINSEAVYLGELLEKNSNEQQPLQIATSLELSSRSLPTLSDMQHQHASTFDLPQFPKRTLPIPKTHRKLAPINRKRSGSLHNDSTDGKISGNNVLESRPIVLTKRREETGKKLLGPIDKKEEFRRFHLSLQADHLPDTVPPNTAANKPTPKHDFTEQTDPTNIKSTTLHRNTNDDINQRLDCSTHLQNRRRSSDDKGNYKPYNIIYRMPTVERKRVEDWLEDCLIARNNQSDDEFIETVSQTNNVSSSTTNGNYPNLDIEHKTTNYDSA